MAFLLMGSGSVAFRKCPQFEFHKPCTGCNQPRMPYTVLQFPGFFLRLPSLSNMQQYIPHCVVPYSLDNFASCHFFSYFTLPTLLPSISVFCGSCIVVIPFLISYSFVLNATFISSCKVLKAFTSSFVWCVWLSFVFFLLSFLVPFVYPRQLIGLVLVASTKIFTLLSFI